MLYGCSLTWNQTLLQHTEKYRLINQQQCLQKYTFVWFFFEDHSIDTMLRSFICLDFYENIIASVERPPDDLCFSLSGVSVLWNWFSHHAFPDHVRPCVHMWCLWASLRTAAQTVDHRERVCASETVFISSAHQMRFGETLICNTGMCVLRLSVHAAWTLDKLFYTPVQWHNSGRTLSDLTGRSLFLQLFYQFLGVVKQ